MHKIITRLFLIVVFLLVNNIYSIVFVGAGIEGTFNFMMHPTICIDPYSQLVFVGAATTPPTNTTQIMSYTLSVYDSKNFRQKKVFLPIVTRNAIINDVFEENPLWNRSIASLSMLQGATLEPKFYPMVTLNNDSHIYIVNNLNIYENNKNHLIATDALLDVHGDNGSIVGIAPGTNKFVAAVLPSGGFFSNGQSALVYDFIVKEKIIPLPGSKNYYTLLQLSTVTPECVSNTNSKFLVGSDLSCDIVGNTLLLGSVSTINSFYIGFSASGLSGVKVVSLLHDNIIDKNIESSLTSNKIVMTGQSNTPLYVNQLLGGTISSGLSYLFILGGTTIFPMSKSIVYGLPLINYTDFSDESNSNSSVGQLANIHSHAKNLFHNTSPYLFINTIFTDVPKTADDLYSWNDYRAIVGAIPLNFYDKSISFQNTINAMSNSSFIINAIESYKDTVFSYVSYNGGDGQGVGGVFYSQALLDEYGAVARWSIWMRKDMIGNIINGSYIPFLGSHFALCSTRQNTVVANEVNAGGAFPMPSIILNTEAGGTGIQKIIDIPYTHPAIGYNALSKNHLSPSYALYLGYNTVILQQTANNSGMLPIVNNTVYYAKNGFGPHSTSGYTMIVFQGGALHNAGILWTGDFAFDDSDAWLVIGGENGLFVLSDEVGNGTGSALLQENFIGLEKGLSWKPLGNFGVVKKIIPSKGCLFVMEDQAIWKISMSSSSIQKGRVIEKKKIVSIYDLPHANNYSSFLDVLVSQNVMLIASSCGLFTSGSQIALDQSMHLEQIILPESLQAAPIMLFPVTYNGCHLDWANGLSSDICSNIYVLATSLSHHYSFIYRLVSYGSLGFEGTGEATIKILPNFFINNISSYYYNPDMELLSIASDGASILTHGVTGNSTLFRSYVGIVNPFIKHGLISLKFEYNFFDILSHTNTFLGYPTYISGLGIWLFVGQTGIQGLC